MSTAATATAAARAIQIPLRGRETAEDLTRSECRSRLRMRRQQEKSRTTALGLLMNCWSLCLTPRREGLKQAAKCVPLIQAT